MSMEVKDLFFPKPFLFFRFLGRAYDCWSFFHLVGFLSGGDLPELLTNLSSKSRKKSGKKSKHKKQSFSDRKSEENGSSSPEDGKRSTKKKREKQYHSDSSLSDFFQSDRDNQKSSSKSYYSSKEYEPNGHHHHHPSGKRMKRRKHCYSSGDSDHNMNRHRRHIHSFPPTVSKQLDKQSEECCNPEAEGQPRSRNGKRKKYYDSYYQDSGKERQCGKNRHKHFRSQCHIHVDSD